MPEPPAPWAAAATPARVSPTQPPAMPVVRPPEGYHSTVPMVLVDAPRAIGWQWRGADHRGPAFVLVARTALGSLKVPARTH